MASSYSESNPPENNKKIMLLSEMKPIIKNKVIAVEGKDEENFFSALLKHLNINNIEIHDVMGKDKYKDKLPALIKSSNFAELVEYFSVIRDADKNAGSAFKSIRNILLKSGLKPPNNINTFAKGNPKVGIYILPGNSNKGMLEDLCMETVKDNPAMKCVDDFSKCVKKLSEKPKNLSKSKAQVYLAAMPVFANSIGRGAQKNYWDFDSPVLNDLKTFLEHFR